jgi:hypothetical protein
VVPRVLDPEKDTGVEEADPYILALAIQLQGLMTFEFMTEHAKDLPTKMSLRTAAGLPSGS